MVLPWISDQRSPAFRDGLLGCPFYDVTGESMRFAVDPKYSLNMKQSPFYKLLVKFFFLLCVLCKFLL